MDVDEVIDALYVPPPAGFTAARDEAAARVRAAGDAAAAKRISKLRRPTLAAWVSNTLVRTKPAEVEQFLQLGQALRAAHHSLDGEQLRDLSHQQHVVIGALAREAGRLAEEAGPPVSETVVREVEQILYAVLADPQAARDWASARLVRAPALVTELPAMDPDSAPPAAAPRPPPDRAEEARLEAARATAQDAEWAASAREEELRLADEARKRAVARAADADAEVGRLDREAEQARTNRDLAYEAVAEAEVRHREADRAAREARLAATAAGQRLRALQNPPPDGAPDG
ncbi:hypothetical protein ACWDYJ_28075 [Streptomyces sp. NPDC003042]